MMRVLWWIVAAAHLTLAQSVVAGDWVPYGIANGGRVVATHPTIAGRALIAGGNEDLITFVTPDGGAHWTGNPLGVSITARPVLAESVAWAADQRALLRTTDEGRTWAPVAVPANDGFVIAGVNPVNAGEVVLAAGDRLLLTSNAGASWSDQPIPSAVRSASVDWMTRRIYAVASDGTILRRALDAPGTWQGTVANAQFVSAGHGLVFYAAVEDPLPPSPRKATLHRSIDQGATFSKVADATFQEFFSDVAFSGSPARIYATDSRRIRRSDDGGATWVDGAFLPGLDDGYGHVAVDAANPDKVYAATSRGVLISVDAGITFATLDRASSAPGRPRSIAVDPVDPMRQWLVAPHLFTAETLLERTTDGGATWSVLNSAEYAYAASRVRPNTLFSYSGSRYQVSTDGGSTWNATFDASPFASFSLQVLAQRTGSPTLVLAGQGPTESGEYATRVFVSPDDGQTFGEKAAPPIRVETMAIAPSTSATIYAGGYPYVPGEPILWRSTDGATTWLPIGTFAPKILGWTSNDVFAIAVDPRDAARVYAGFVYPDNLMRSDDGGASWKRITSGLGAGAVTSIAIDPTNPDTIYAAVYLSGVFRSLDRGAHWTPLDAGLRDDAVRQVAFDPFRPGRVYAGTNSGLYKVDLGSGVPSGRRRAVEFYHSEFNHYFVSADVDEIDGLDAGVFQGWQRTNIGFRVAEPQAPGNLATCRFFGVGFGTLSSHFYTQYPTECDGLKSNPAWLYEKIAFGLALPDPSTHGCAPGTRPLFRAWNRNAGGAPNHRYTTSPPVLDAMIGFGWQFEGELSTRVFACVPAE